MITMVSVLYPFEQRVNLMTKFVNRENWFITHVIREICKNLNVKRDQDSPPPPPINTMTTTMDMKDKFRGETNR